MFILKSFKSNVLEVFIPEGLEGDFLEVRIPKGLANQDGGWRICGRSGFEPPVRIAKAVSVHARVFGQMCTAE